jgi:threonine-phosphate decarboxylase
MLQGHGDDVVENIDINFSSNVWYGAKNFWLQEHLNKNFEVISRYPEVLPQRLIEQIAQHYELTSQQILVTNGATEAIYLIAQTFQNSDTTIISPTFSEYADACILNKHKIHYISEPDFTNALLPNNGLIFICNPNNPTGKAYPTSMIEKLLADHPNLLFIIDESYADFTQIPCNSVSLIDQYPNLILLKSLTKGFAIPGLRLGYILSNPEFITKVQRYKMPWSVNALAIEAGNYFFMHWDDYSIPIYKWLHETSGLMDQISSIPGFNCHPSDTTFFIGTTAMGDATRLKSFLLDEYSILIRDASNFKGLTPSHFRICTQSHPENQLLTDALRKWTTLF